MGLEVQLSLEKNYILAVLKRCPWHPEQASSPQVTLIFKADLSTTGEKRIPSPYSCQGFLLAKPLPFHKIIKSKVVTVLCIYYTLYIYIYVYIYKNLKPTPRGQWRIWNSHIYIYTNQQWVSKFSIPRFFAVTVQAWCKQCCLMCLTRLVWDSHSIQVVVWSDTPRGQAHR